MDRFNQNNQENLCGNGRTGGWCAQNQNTARPCPQKQGNCCCPGPPGPPGPRGPVGPQGPEGPAGVVILDSYDSYAELIAAHPRGSAGEAYLAAGELYVWDNTLGTWKSLGSVVGPQGPEGPAGVVILDSYDSYAELIAAHPSGSAGEAYLAAGELYVWDDTLDEWKSLGSVVGPQGPEGPAGVVILDSYDSYAELITAHPRGSAGEAYLAAGELYVWDDTLDEWKSLGSVVGPEGPTGANGADGVDGADGVIGQIVGVVATAEQLPAQGAAPGELYYVEEDESVYVWDAENEWTRISVAQGPRGPEGPPGPQGPAGADGLMGPIKGIVDSADDLPATGAEQGDLYYVKDDGLYAWDEVQGWVSLDLMQGPRGLDGEQGPAGPAASSHMIVPFASTEAPYTYSNNGEPSRVTLLGFGYGDRRNFGVVGSADYAIEIDPSNQSFSLTSAAGNENKQLAFSLPFAVRIRSMAITVGNWATFSPEHAVFPYVQLYSAAPGSNNFFPIDGALVIPEQGIGPGTNVQADTMRAALRSDLDIPLPAGTRIGIGAMMQIPGDVGNAREYWIYFTGGIGMTYDSEE